MIQFKPGMAKMAIKIGHRDTSVIIVLPESWTGGLDG
jgi:hypothetical protein